MFEHSSSSGSPGGDARALFGSFEIEPWAMVRLRVLTKEKHTAAFMKLEEYLIVLGVLLGLFILGTVLSQFMGFQ